MTQRNPMNERYQDDNRGGKTRKSAASAKPTAVRAGTVRDPAPKTKKQKKQEAKERERKNEQRYTVDVPTDKLIKDLPEYKRLRRIWWVCLVGAIMLMVVTVYAAGNESINFLYIPCLVLGYILVIAAFYIDFRKIRNLRKQYQADAVAQGKSKEARAQQKAARAEARAQQKEAQEKFDAAKAEEEAKKANSPLTRLKNRFSPSSDSSGESQAAEGEAAGK